MEHKRLTLFAGHYGSGKTNIAVNYAIAMAKEGKPVCIEGSFESDVNANSLANGSRVRPLLILGITPPAIFDGADARTFYEMCGEM